MISKFICEKCEKVFGDEITCAAHELTCVGKQVIVKICIGYTAVLYVVCVPGSKGITMQDDNLIFATNKEYASKFAEEDKKSIDKIVEKILENIYKSKLEYRSIKAYKKVEDYDFDSDTELPTSRYIYRKIEGCEEIKEALDIEVMCEEV